MFGIKQLLFTSKVNVIAVTVTLTLSACGNTQKGQDVIAAINHEPITQQQFNTYLKYKNIPLGQKEKSRKHLDHYLERSVLAKAMASGDKLDLNAIDFEVEEFKRQLVISRYFEQYLKDNVNETAVRNYYASNPDKFQSEQVHVAHILIRTNPKLSDNERLALSSKAGEAYSKINLGEDFAEIAKSYSGDKVSAKKGGDLGWLKRDAIDPLFSEQAFTLNEGEMSKPFETPFGFHIIKVLSPKKVIKKPYEKVKCNIQYQLRVEAKRAEKQRLVASTTVELFGQYKKEDDK